MAFLAHRRWLLFGGFALTSTIAACLVGGGEEPVSRFRHQDHGADRGLQCLTCHLTATTGRLASLPGPQLCAPCHDDLDEDKPQADRIAAMFDVSGRYLNARGPRLDGEISFTHASHVSSYRLDCAECHGDVGVSTVIAAPRKSACLECHSNAGKSIECRTCHTVIDRQWVPPTHRSAWNVRHGQVVREREPSVINRCDMCHDQASSCNACHQVKQPRDHTDYWRLRGHGIAVSIDRSRCSVCHKPDSCDRCHSVTRPRSHRGGYGSPSDRHCNDCHFPLQGTSCFVCHKSDPSHAMATPLPPGHSPAMNCRQCHIGATLPHPDNGQTCTTCHR